MNQMLIYMKRVMSDENLFLKIVTAGKLHKKSLVFHFQCDDCSHEFQIKRVHTGSITVGGSAFRISTKKLNRCIRHLPYECGASVTLGISERKTSRKNRSVIFSSR